MSSLFLKYLLIYLILGHIVVAIDYYFEKCRLKLEMRYKKYFYISFKIMQIMKREAEDGNFFGSYVLFHFNGITVNP